MNDIETKLKDMIIEKYGSLKKFASTINIPYPTLDSIFKRGLKKCSSVNLIKICSELNISASQIILNNVIEPYSPSDEIVKSDIYQEFLINTAELALIRRKIVLDIIAPLKRVIEYNDANDIFTNVPEEDLLYYFWSLNDEGKKEAIQRISEMTFIPSYRSDTTDDTQSARRKKEATQTAYDSLNPHKKVTDQQKVLAAEAGVPLPEWEDAGRGIGKDPEGSEQ